MMIQSSVLQCPDCQRVLHFAHEATNVLRCDCGSVIGRENGVLSSRSVLAVQENFGIIQPGTEGVWKGKKFRVLGRLRAWMEEFVFNYWTIVFDDGELTLLGEGYGLYAIYEKEPDLDSLTPLLEEGIQVGEHQNLARRTYLLERKHTCYKWEVEGEAWLPLWHSGFLIYEFCRTNGLRMELMGRVRQQPEAAFNVQYTSFRELELTGLRTEEGEGKIITCSNCSAENHIKTFPLAQSFACIQCGARHGLKEEAGFKRETEPGTVDATQGIALGTKGRFRNIDYEVIGFTMKEEQNIYRSRWREYTLYNSAEGYAFLSEYDGHWTWVRERGDAPVALQPLGAAMDWQDEEYPVFNSYTYSTIHAVGEFPYNIFNDDNDKQVREYISPPEVWILEKHPHEGIIWYLGEHVRGQELTAAFGDSVVLPHKVGIGAIEPKGYISPFKLAFMTFMALVALCILHVSLSATKREQHILEQEIPFADSAATTASFVSQRFTLDKWKSNLQFYVYTYMDNSWLEWSAVLVNAKDGTEYSINEGMEFYQGYEDGERWTEGSLSGTGWISSIPAGEYGLQFQVLRDPASLTGRPPASFTVKVTYDVINHRNLLMCVLFLLVWPLITFARVRYVESQRWRNSPFSPQSNE